LTQTTEQDSDEVVRLLIGGCASLPLSQRLGA
jgi:hypothetical protein